MMKITHHSKIKITPFFEKTLGVKLNNPRQSWGAVDIASNRVFLRIWEDQIKEDGNGLKVQVYWKVKRSKSNGYAERLKHLAIIQDGAVGIGILCEADDPNPVGNRKIKSFDDEQLLLLGEISEDDGFKYARIVKNFPISELANSTIVSDIKAIISKTTDPTTVQALVSARVGQGKFGFAVRQLWNHRCSVTGASTKAVLEASHIQRWADSTDIQRLDPNNGLLLTANLHKLFDAGLISFDDSGKMLVSSKLSQSEQEIFGLVGKKLSKKPSAETANYLSYHRTKFSE
jgi:putative restriction endonuclease